MLYIIADVDKRVMKIGVTTDIDNRLKLLQTGNHLTLNVATTIKTQNDYRVETELHKYLADSRLKGEWFVYNEAFIDNIMYIIEKYVQYNDIEKIEYILKPKTSSTILTLSNKHTNILNEAKVYSKLNNISLKVYIFRALRRYNILESIKHEEL